MADLIEVAADRFHPIWLRDNCLCAECRHAHTFWKTFDGTELPEHPPVATSVELTADALVVVWDGEPAHRSVYPREWLAAHAGGHQELIGRRLYEHTLWNADTWQTAGLPVHSIADCVPDGGPWAEDLARYGFAFLDGAVDTELTEFAAGIGPLQPTEFGRFLAVVAKPEANHLVKSGTELTPHTDFSTYLNMAPQLQFMYFVANDATGGDSIIVDGFAVAERFRADHPDHFELLTTMPVNFQQVYPEWGYFLAKPRTVIELDFEGQVSGVFFHHSHTGNWDLPPELTERFYLAYHTFFRYLRDPAAQLRVHTPAGRCILLRNGRILHGRTAYDPRSGGRSLVDFYVPWEYFEARLRFRRFKHFYQPPPSDRPEQPPAEARIDAEINDIRAVFAD